MIGLIHIWKVTSHVNVFVYVEKYIHRSWKFRFFLISTAQCWPFDQFCWFTPSQNQKTDVFQIRTWFNRSLCKQNSGRTSILSTTSSFDNVLCSVKWRPIFIHLSFASFFRNANIYIHLSLQFNVGANHSETLEFIHFLEIMVLR